MPSPIRMFGAIAIGAVLGVVNARYVFVGSWLCLVPWTIAGLAVGWWCARAGAAITGGAYGFALAFVFMIAGYSGRASLASRLPGFAILGLVGAVCGAVLALVGAWLGRRTAPRMLS